MTPIINHGSADHQKDLVCCSYCTFVTFCSVLSGYYYCTVVANLTHRLYSSTYVAILKQYSTLHLMMTIMIIMIIIVVNCQIPFYGTLRTMCPVLPTILPRESSVTNHPP